MTFAILGDIHSNWEALSAVLDDAASRGVTDYACVGDIVGYNADPAVCLDAIRERTTLTVRGNHDHYCSNSDALEGFHPLAADVVAWTRDQLDESQVAYLRDLPYSRTIKGFTLVHSTLDAPDRWGYVYDKLEAEANFNYQMTAVCFFGHTHVPLAFEKAADVSGGAYRSVTVRLGRRYFINVGSVGQPRDGDPRAAYVTYEPATGLVELHRVAYDIAGAQAKIRAAGLPERLAARLDAGS